MRKLALLTAITCLGAPLAHADSLDLSLNDTSFAARYTTPRFLSGAQFDLGWLHDTKDGNIGDVSFLIGQDLNHNASASLGVRAAYIDGNGHSGYAIGLGGNIESSLPGNDKLKLGGHLFYAPQVTSFGNVTSYTDFGVRFGCQVLKEGQLYIAYQYNNAEMKDNYASATVAHGLRVGMDLNF